MLNFQEIPNRIINGDDSVLDELLSNYKKMSSFIKIDPKMKKTNEYVKTTAYIGMCYSKLNMWEESVKFYKMSTDVVYIPDICKNYSYSLLHNGDIKEGMRIYDNRYKSENSDLKLPKLSIPYIREISRFNKSDKVIVINEQGLGDDILFSRSIHTLSEKVSKVKWKCPESLLGVYKKMFKDLKNVEFFLDILDEKEVRKYTCWTSTGDLFSSLSEYLIFEDYVQKSNFDIKDNMNIAISYKTNAVNLIDGQDLSLKKNIDPSIFGDIIKSHNVFNYTVGETINGIQNYPNPPSYSETRYNLIKNKIDLSVSIDSSFAHFTAMMGIPTIVLVTDQYHDWRWKYTDEDGYNKFFKNVKVMDITEFLNTFVR